jgi:hypothetical protein
MRTWRLKLRRRWTYLRLFFRKYAVWNCVWIPSFGVICRLHLQCWTQTTSEGMSFATAWPKFNLHDNVSNSITKSKYTIKLQNKSFSKCALHWKQPWKFYSNRIILKRNLKETGLDSLESCGWRQVASGGLLSTRYIQTFASARG